MNSPAPSALWPYWHTYLLQPVLTLTTNGNKSQLSVIVRWCSTGMNVGRLQSPAAVSIETERWQRGWVANDPPTIDDEQLGAQRQREHLWVAVPDSPRTDQTDVSIRRRATPPVLNLFPTSLLLLLLLLHQPSRRRANIRFRLSALAPPCPPNVLQRESSSRLQRRQRLPVS